MDAYRTAGQPDIAASADAAENVQPSGRRRRGLKPGQRHSGQFQKGFDPRRYVEGPRVTKKAFQEAIREHTDKAIGVLVDTMQDADAPYKERRAAAELVLAHAEGLPVNRVLHAQAAPAGHDLTQLSNEELLRLAEKTAASASDGASNAALTLENGVVYTE